MPPKKATAAATKAAPKPSAKKGTSPADKSSKAGAHTSAPAKHVSEANGMFDVANHTNHRASGSIRVL